ncbi:MAG: hypothetical protein ACFCGT_03480 [Sandaracinaceae bacterium]
MEFLLAFPVQSREDFVGLYDEPRLTHDVSLPEDWYVAFASVSPWPCTPGQRLAEDRSAASLSGEISFEVRNLLVVPGEAIPVDIRGELDGVTAFMLRGTLPELDGRAWPFGPCRTE